MTNVKLHINISQGIIDAEGDQEFVWRVYEDFRARLGSIPMPSNNSPSLEEVNSEEDQTENSVAILEGKPKKRSIKRKSASASSSNSNNKEKLGGVTGHKPSILNNLDTSGLKDFLSGYKLKNNVDIIVALTRFLENKGVKPASINAYFTCYRDAGLKMPVAFGQAFVDVRAKKGFIEFSNPEDVTLTIRGVNHLEHGGIKRSGE